MEIDDEMWSIKNIDSEESVKYVVLEMFTWNGIWGMENRDWGRENKECTMGHGEWSTTQRMEYGNVIHRIEYPEWIMKNVVCRM